MLNKNQMAQLTVYFKLSFLLILTLSSVYRQKIILIDIFIALKKDNRDRVLPLKIQALRAIALRQNVINFKPNN
jgi:hypothetical protein